MLNRLKKYEEEYCCNNYCGDNKGDNFRFEDRGSRLILTAPHAVRTLRDNQPKAPDLFTGALTRLTGEQNNVSAVIRRRTGEERNAAIGFVTDRQLAAHGFLDIHGMNGSREFELAVGTGILPATDYVPEIELIGQLAEKYKIRWVINHPNYTGRYGLTGSLQRLTSSPQILQLEWRSDLRDFYLFPANVLERTLPFLSELATNGTLFFRQKKLDSSSALY